MIAILKPGGGLALTPGGTFGGKPCISRTGGVNSGRRRRAQNVPPMFVAAIFLASLFVLTGLAPALLGAQQATPSGPSAPPGPPESSRPPRRARSFEFMTNFGSGAWLGVNLKDVTADDARTMKLPGVYGAIVVHVAPDSPAAKAGMQQNDVILEFGGMRVWSAAQLAQLVRETPPGRTVTLGISRAGRKLNVTASLANRSARAGMPEFEIPRFHVRIPPRTFNFHFAPFGPHLGIQAQTLTPQLASYFGVMQGKGVLVDDVEKDSPAAKAGLEAGDCIVKIGSTPIASVFDLRNALVQVKGTRVSLSIVRAKREQMLTATIEPGWQPHPMIQGHVVVPGMEMQLREIRRELPRTEEIQKQLEQQMPRIEQRAQQLEQQAQQLKQRIQVLQQRTSSGEV